MIARISVLIPFTFSIVEGHKLETIEHEIGGYRVLIYPPRQATFKEPIHPLMPHVYDLHATQSRLTPAGTPLVMNALTIEDRPTYFADLVLIEFFAPDFDRRKDTGVEDSKDPIVILAFSLLNQMIERIRRVTRNVWPKPLSADSSSWSLEYCNDDRSFLSFEDGLVGSRSMLNFNVRFSYLSDDIWSLAWQESNFRELRNWDKLLLDAVEFLPEVGAAVSVANAGIEAFAIWMNNVLANSSAMDKDFWNWIENRDHFQQNPSVKDRFDVILKNFTGHSLKESPELWQVLTDLRKARNSFMHEGAIRIAKKGAALSQTEADTLVRRSSEIVTWVETFLPEDERRFMRKEQLRIEMDLQNRKTGA